MSIFGLFPVLVKCHYELILVQPCLSNYLWFTCVFIVLSVHFDLVWSTRYSPVFLSMSVMPCPALMSPLKTIILSLRPRLHVPVPPSCVHRDTLVTKLQLVQNAAARVLTRTRKYEHISPVLSTLHWLPTKHRIDFKILLMTYKALNGLAPQYLSELLSHYSPPRPLRSQNSGHFKIPRISKSTAGGRSFSFLAPKLWNNLPNTVREADTLCQYKSRLKTHLFNLAYT